MMLAEGELEVMEFKADAAVGIFIRKQPLQGYSLTVGEFIKKTTMRTFFPLSVCSYIGQMRVICTCNVVRHHMKGERATN